MKIRDALASAFRSSARSRPDVRTSTGVGSAATYEVLIQWEEFLDGELRTTHITKQLQVLLTPRGAGRVIFFRASQPALVQKEEPEHMQRMALQLSALYAEIEAELSPNGELSSLLNHAELVLTWANLREELIANSSPDDAVTHKLIALFDAQMEQPDKVLYSLRHDYMYQALAMSLRASEQFNSPPIQVQREFSQFFPKLDLRFHETRQLVAAEADGIHYTLRGSPDTQSIDTAAVRQAMHNALTTNPAAAPTPAGAPEEPLHLGYEAAYSLDQADGLPRHLHLTVYGRLAQRYNKQYTLTLTRIL
ncbi:hypothetical protein [Hymenobacter sp. DG01]|uniref:hypothetical protein n=1 Tax=Hymenobacter sp. DG01 TaxID=2584940 RepID=UPI00111E6A2F|nr:hypothetical protein [Hymenobacter sp. DG01]